MLPPITYLELGLKAGDDGGRDEAADAAAVDAQHGDQPPLRRRRGQHRRAIAVHGELILVAASYVGLE